jgi:threonine/homoserine/homoserine lactone efflux protein
MLESSELVMDLDLPLRGLAAGFIIAAPVGPVNVLCIQRTLEKGWKPGMVAGTGAAVGDSLYGGVAGFSISIIIQFLIQEEFWFRFIGGLLLMVIGVVYYFRRPPTIVAGKNGSSSHSDFAAAFLLTVANPTTVLSFLTVLATFGLGRQRPAWETSLLITGIFCGSMTWWLVLASGASLLRGRITDRTMGWMNRLAGVAIGSFGLANVVLSRGHRH